MFATRRGRAKAAARHARAAVAPAWPTAVLPVLVAQEPADAAPTVVLPAVVERIGPVVRLGFADGTTLQVTPELGRPLHQLATELLRRG